MSAADKKITEVQLHLLVDYGDGNDLEPPMILVILPLSEPATPAGFPNLTDKLGITSFFEGVLIEVLGVPYHEAWVELVGLNEAGDVVATVCSDALIPESDRQAKREWLAREGQRQGEVLE